MVLIIRLKLCLIEVIVRFLSERLKLFFFGTAANISNVVQQSSNLFITKHFGTSKLRPKETYKMHSEALLLTPIYLISKGLLKNGSFVLKMLVNKFKYLHSAETARSGGCSVSSHTLNNDRIKGGSGVEL